MLFHSFTFLGFFATLYAAYLFLQPRVLAAAARGEPRSTWFKAQNTLLLLGSLVFYGSWDWRFLILMLVTAGVDHFAALAIHGSNSSRTRRRWLLVSLISNLGVLGFFKYFNFFIQSASDGLVALGLPPMTTTLNVILPVGISFYTFQSLSYTIDVYRGQMPPARNIWTFWLFVSFFPQLVAGPIERASHLLPQVESPRRIDAHEADLGVYLILWGFFKKLVIADNLAAIANPVFADPSKHSGAGLYLAAIAFAGQIYCDFSAYSDIARGLCKFMGFDLMLNFRIPYAAVSPSDFWRRWHISLSTWLRDYLYVPLGGNRGSSLLTYRNLFLTMLLGGLWHGAAWNFVLWGAFHGLLLILFRPFQSRLDSAIAPERPAWSRLLALTALRVFMFHAVLLGWVFFRCESLHDIGAYLSGVVRGWGSVVPASGGGSLSTSDSARLSSLLFFVAPLIVMETIQHRMRDLNAPTRWPLVVRVAFYALLLAGIVVFGARESVEFIYFQF